MTVVLVCIQNAYKLQNSVPMAWLYARIQTWFAPGGLEGLTQLPVETVGSEAPGSGSILSGWSYGESTVPVKFILSRIWTAFFEG